MAKKKNSQKPKKEGSAPRRKGGGRGGLWIVILAAALTIIFGIIFLSYYGARKTAPTALKKPRAAKEIRLYYASPDGEHLRGEAIRINAGTLDEEVREALDLLVRNDSEDDGRTIPAGARLVSLKIQGSTAYADFSRELSKNHPGGSAGEMLTVYSIVDTVTENFPQIKDVQILIDGKKAETLAGHIDISFPLAPDREIIKK